MNQDARGYLVRVTGSADTPVTPCDVAIPGWTRPAAVPEGAASEPCQIKGRTSSRLFLTFLAPALKKGESRLLWLIPDETPKIQVKSVEKNVEILIEGALFTRYDVTTGPNKPYLYPIRALGGKPLTRRWPLEEVAGEERDHPHHRGLWFTHGAMNGIDFWTEGAGTGKSVHTRFDGLRSGSVQGSLSARADWIGPDGKKIAEDTRFVTVTPLPGGNILLDFMILVKAVGGPLHWGDTKEGTFALRVPESMKVDKPGGGTLINAEGLKNAALWGKKSPWNDYFGPVMGETLGMAIFDHPENLRYPTTWHSRTYGLFAANPFGLHDFDATKKTPKGAGDLITPEGKSVTFRYRVYFHRGDTSAADVAGHFAGWATPPTVEIL